MSTPLQIPCDTPPKIDTLNIPPPKKKHLKDHAVVGHHHQELMVLNQLNVLL